MKYRKTSRKPYCRFVACPTTVVDDEIIRINAVLLTGMCAGTEDDHQDYEYLVSWGSHFDKLADMYSRDGEHELDEEQ